MKKALIYARVSTAEQAKEGQSIEAQIKLCRQFAKENKLTIPKDGIYKDEGKSGTNTNRPGLQSVLERISDDEAIKAVLVLDTDRLARNTLDHLSIKSLLKKHAVELISISQPMIDDSPEGNFIDVVLAGANALQSQITGRKTKKVMQQKIEAGWWAGWAPVGYINVDNPSPKGSFDKRIVVPDPDKASLIKQLFNLYASGTYNTEKLTKKMNRLGLTNRRGDNIGNSAVNHILNNCFYYGDMEWKNKTYPGKHEPLIDKATWQTCQTIMKRHNQNASRKRKHNFLLRGYLYCDDCGSRFWGEERTKNGKKYKHYFCSKCKGGTYTDMDDLEQQVEDWFGKVTMTENYADELRAAAQETIKEMRKANNQEKQAFVNKKSAIEAKIRTAEDRLLDGTLDKDQFNRIMDRLEPQLNEVKQELDQISQDYSKSFEGVERLIDMARNIQGTYKQANEDLKREYLGLFFEKFMVKEGKIVLAYPSKQLKPLIKNGKISVRVSEVWLPVHRITRKEWIMSKLS